VQTKIVGLLFILGLVAAGIPIVNLAERTRVQGIVNDYLTQANAHILKDKKQVEDFLYDKIAETVGDDATLEIIQYQFEGLIPANAVADPGAIPNLPGIERRSGYYQVSALITRVYWAQRKLMGERRDEDGNFVGRCYLCPSDTRAERVLFVPAEYLANMYMRAPGDLDFAKHPELLFDQFK